MNGKSRELTGNLLGTYWVQGARVAFLGCRKRIAKRKDVASLDYSMQTDSASKSPFIEAPTPHAEGLGQKLNR